MHFRIVGAVALLAALLTLAPVLPAADKAADKAEPKAAAEAKTEAKAETKAEAKAEAKADEADKGATASDNHKSAGVAGGLAFFPGMAVHGAGHMYAGSWMKGLGLLAIEGVSAYYIADSIANGPDEIKMITEGDKGVPVDVSKGYMRIGIATVSIMAFMWSWWDDMSGAPIAVSEYNKMQDEAVARVRVSPREDGAAVALSTDF